MPWAATLLIAIWLLMLIPVVQTALALIIAFVTMPAVAPVLQATEPVITLLMSKGIRGGVAAIAASSIVVAPLVAFFLYRYLRHGLTIQQRRRSLNALILALGVPLTIAYAWWLLPDKFG
ncbi:MAG TPA: hypothetical protein VJL90_06915 [Pseudorhodoplanes sp.]|nr:hypothetical protein [Pseudorhodoplanes sp.]